MQKQPIIIEIQGGKVANVYADDIAGYIVVDNDTDDPIDWNPIQPDPRNAFLLDEVPEPASQD